VNLAGFRNCLADHTVHSLLSSYQWRSKGGTQAPGGTLLIKTKFLKGVEKF